MTKSSISILIVFVLVVGFFYTFESNSTEEKEIEKEVLTQSIEKSINISAPKKNIIKKVFRDEVAPTSIEAKDKKIVLYKALNKERSHVLNLVAAKTIAEKKEMKVKYLPLKVKLLKDEKITSFTVSLKDSYKNDYNSELSFELLSINDNKLSTCDATFLKELNFDYLYYINMDLINDEITCYIDKKSKLMKFDNNKMKVNLEKIDINKIMKLN